MFAAREMKNTDQSSSVKRQISQNSGEQSRQVENQPRSISLSRRYIGNSKLQSPAAGNQRFVQDSPTSGIRIIQRKCACGGSCPSCANKEIVGERIQAKLTIGPANDIYEQEADRVADQIMRMPESSEKADDGQSNTEIRIQRLSGIASGTQDSYPDLKLNQSGGRPLSDSTRQFMEPRFGVDFGHVRMHTGQDAQQSASQIQARAFTYGNHVWLGKGAKETDKSLMAHELTHVVQQASILSRLTSAPSTHDKDIAMGRNKSLDQPTIQLTSSKNNLQRKRLQSYGGSTSIAGTKMDGVPGDQLLDPLFLVIDGPPSPGMTLSPNIANPNILRQPIPAPSFIRVAQNHQFPITTAHVASGWRSGFGGVSEIEVGNGNTDYDGTNVSEHFIGGLGNNTQIGGCNNQSGQGGQAGSTFTVGTGVNFSQNGLNINLPPKHNKFYDMHIKGMGTNILPAGVNSQFSVCVQRFSFGGSSIRGIFGLFPAIFFRLHGINRRTVGGQDVADIDLFKI